MNNYLIFLFQVSICFSVLYLTFYGFLRGLTFHKLNRMILLLMIPLSLTLPVLQVISPDTLTITNENNNVLISLNELVQLPEQAGEVIIHSSSTNKLSLNYLIVLVYWVGFFIGITRLLSGIIRLLFIRKKSITKKDGRYQLLIAEVPTIFSFFHLIFIPKNKEAIYKNAVLEHEKAHARLFHTADLILTELYIAICWFNPLVYFFRKSIKSLHEFQADREALRYSGKKSQYLQLLLKNLEVKHPLKISSYFNHPIIKKRIDMIMKTDSKRRSIMRYLLLLPLVAVLLMAFSHPKMDSPSFIPNETMSSPNLEPPSIFPVPSADAPKITQPYGVVRVHPIMKKKLKHRGIDIRADEGTPVVATADGTVATAENKDKWGNLIIITHSDGYETWYAHLQGFNVEASQTVKKGQVIGYVGTTGMSTGPHLHYEVLKDNVHVDPADYFESE